MPLLITRLLGFFSSTGPIAQFFYMLGKRLALTALIVPLQITLIGALIVGRIALFTAIITLMILTYNKFIDIVSKIESLSTTQIFVIPYQILESMGIIQAMIESFAFFSVVFTSLLLAFIAKMAVISLQSLSDEYYKIGVLLQLGLK